MTGRRTAIPIGLLVLGTVALSGCGPVSSAESEAKVEYTLTEVKGSDHPIVTLTKKGADQIGLKTEEIKAAGADLAVPYAAVLYDAHGGQPYVFAQEKGLSFRRHDITVTRVEGDTAISSSGPPVGTAVVTVGTPQVHGAELEFGEY